MGNYRGGYAGESKYGQELVKKINEGNTQGQRDRDMMQRVILTGIKTGLVGGQAAGSVLYGEHLKNVAAKAAADNQYQSIKAREARANTAQQAYDDSQLRQSANKYAAPDYDGYAPAAPAWLRASEDKLPADAEAGEALDRQQANVVRQQADSPDFRGSGIMGSAPYDDEDPYRTKG